MPLATPTADSPQMGDSCPPYCSASSDAVQYADYILNHYSRDSHTDKLCLARDLERHGWRKKELSSDTPETDAAINDSVLEDKNHPHTDWVPAYFARKLERERNAASLPNAPMEARRDGCQPQQPS